MAWAIMGLIQGRPSLIVLCNNRTPRENVTQDVALVRRSWQRAGCPNVTTVTIGDGKS